MKPMSFAEQAAELHQLEAVARSLGLSEAAFERIALDVTAEAWIAGNYPPEQQLAEIRRRINECCRDSGPYGASLFNSVSARVETCP